MRIVIAFATESELFVRQISAVLEQFGISCWAEVALESARYRLQAVSAAISEADAFVYVISAQSACSDFGLAEIEMARRQALPIIAISRLRPFDSVGQAWEALPEQAIVSDIDDPDTLDHVIEILLEQLDAVAGSDAQPDRYGDLYRLSERTYQDYLELRVDAPTIRTQVDQLAQEFGSLAGSLELFDKIEAELVERKPALEEPLPPPRGFESCRQDNSVIERVFGRCIDVDLPSFEIRDMKVVCYKGGYEHGAPSKSGKAAVVEAGPDDVDTIAALSAVAARGLTRADKSERLLRELGLHVLAEELTERLTRIVATGLTGTLTAEISDAIQSALLRAEVVEPGSSRFARGDGVDLIDLIEANDLLNRSGLSPASARLLCFDVFSHRQEREGQNEALTQLGVRQSSHRHSGSGLICFERTDLASDVRDDVCDFDNMRPQ